MSKVKHQLLSEVETTLTGYWLSDLSTFCSIIYNSLPMISWVGFYLSDGTKLRLAQFMGKPACTEIEFTRGVCGAAFSKSETMLIDNVHDFPGHIACDAKSQSEMVIPFYIDSKKIGVLDIDSYELARFNEFDRELVTEALKILSAKLSGNDKIFSSL